MTSPDLISKNLKLLKIDIWIHSLLLFLWLAIPVGFYLLSFTLPDQKPCIYSTPECSSPRDEMILSIMNILLFTGIVSIIWQIISWYSHQLFTKIHTQRTKKVREVIIFYYFILTNMLLCLYVFWFLGYFVVKIITFCLYLFPIVWLVYYVNLFSQKKFLETELKKNAETAS